MSGDIVQRGSAAVASKFLRAEAALNCGADLVLELPIPWCCSSAEDFASAGVHIANNIGSNYLAFGAEDGYEVLKEIFDLISTETFSSKIKEYINIKGNVSYPKALCDLIEEELGCEYSQSAKKPNNILALEYMSALNGTNVLPFAVKREAEFLSSSQIRSEGDGESMLRLLPENSKSVFEKALGTSFPRDPKKLDAFFIGALRKLRSVNERANNLYSVPQDLFNKIISSSLKYSSVDELATSCSDKTYTSARIRRAINSIVFEITASRVHKMPMYTSVLAANEKGREILKRAKSINGIEIVTKPSKATELGDEIKDQFLFSKGIEDIISLSEPTPESAEKGKTPRITK